MQLKLLALDAEDLQIVSSHCQDAVMRISELEYSPASRSFVMSFNRFAWEKENSSERRKSVLRFSNVTGARLSGIDRKQQGMVISLLTILFVPGENPGGEIELVFAGDGAIRLDVECIEVQLSDLPAAWEASSTPSHQQD